MSGAALVAAALLLQPVLAEDAPLRMAAGETDADVEWVLDGQTVAVTRPGEAATVNVSAGPHELWVRSDSSRHWQAMARVEPPNATGLAYVPAWTARSQDAAPADEPRPHAVDASGRDAEVPDWALPAGVAGLAAALLLWPRRR